jgi:hypothetical protein
MVVSLILMVIKYLEALLKAIIRELDKLSECQILIDYSYFGIIFIFVILTIIILSFLSFRLLFVFAFVFANLVKHESRSGTAWAVILFTITVGFTYDWYKSWTEQPDNVRTLPLLYRWYYQVTVQEPNLIIHFYCLFFGKRDAIFMDQFIFRNPKNLSHENRWVVYREELEENRRKFGEMKLEELKPKSIQEEIRIRKKMKRNREIDKENRDKTKDKNKDKRYVSKCSWVYYKDQNNVVKRKLLLVYPDN